MMCGVASSFAPGTRASAGSEPGSNRQFASDGSSIKKASTNTWRGDTAASGGADGIRIEQGASAESMTSASSIAFSASAILAGSDSTLVLAQPTAKNAASNPRVGKPIFDVTCRCCRAKVLLLLMVLAPDANHRSLTTATARRRHGGRGAVGY